LRIGIMLRHLDQHGGGVKVYTQNVVRHLLGEDRKNRYVLLYHDPSLLGSFGAHSHVEERVLRMPSKLLWDQVAVPVAARRERLDVVFNPKFSVPLAGTTPSVLVLQGSDWFVMPWGSSRLDRLNHQLLVPGFCRRAAAIIVVSHNIKNDLVRYLGVDPRKIRVVYYGLSTLFRPVRDPERLESARRRYGLPERFLLYVGQIYPAKNFGGILRAFARLRSRLPHKLVVAGEPRSDYEKELALIDELGLREDVRFTGWVSQEELPALYSLADVFVFPSLYEGFGIPLLEAMACACPIVTASVGSPPEVTDGAAVLVDPRDVEAIAEAVLRVVSEPALRARLVERGLERAHAFTWERCARQTLDVLESLAAGTAAGASA
jgi:glycosyltransferase involved in cell wall biosynthesis